MCTFYIKITLFISKSKLAKLFVMYQVLDQKYDTEICVFILPCRMQNQTFLVYIVYSHASLNCTPKYSNLNNCSIAALFFLCNDMRAFYVLICLRMHDWLSFYYLFCFLFLSKLQNAFLYSVYFKIKGYRAITLHSYTCQ